MDGHELLSEVKIAKNAYNLEGQKGYEWLSRLARMMGYKDSMYFGQFAPDASIGDMLYFFEDNPGAIEAVLEWIGENMVDEWREGLEAELPATEE